MKKACIVTICGGSNFGNRLQNYALQEVLNIKFGYEAETLHNLSGEILGGKLQTSRAIQRILCSKIVEKLLLKVFHNARVQKKINFLRFNKQYIKWSDFTSHGDNVDKTIVEKYDCFIAGSDQIWNPQFSFNSSTEYLAFAPKEKSVAYAASFGIKEFNESQVEYAKYMLEDFYKISLRESSGLDILKQCGIEDGEVVLDPTMLLTANDWIKIEKKPSFIKDEKYILSYSIWGQNEEVKSYLKNISKENGWKIIDIYDQANVQQYGIGPSEFLYLIHHASFVFTDSFHASVFSILFHKQFSVFIKENMSSRLTTLLGMVGFEYLLDTWKQSNCVDNLNYAMVDGILDKQRQHSFEFLKKAIG